MFWKTPTMPKKRLRVYRLFPQWDGGFSTKTAHYNGRSLDVAAVSIRQAYYFAGNDVWAEGPESPAGVLQSYVRGQGHLCWHTRRDPHHKCASFNHGDGKRAIVRSMKGAHGDNNDTGEADGREQSAHNTPLAVNR